MSTRDPRLPLVRPASNGSGENVHMLTEKIRRNSHGLTNIANHRRRILVRLDVQWGYRHNPQNPRPSTTLHRVGPYYDFGRHWDQIISSVERDLYVKFSDPILGSSE